MSFDLNLNLTLGLYQNFIGLDLQNILLDNLNNQLLDDLGETLIDA